MSIQIKRVYEPATKNDGYRILVDRIWPRGLTKSEACIDLWSKEIAPSTLLRKWFGHDPEKWLEFKTRYLKELSKNKEMLQPILTKAHSSKVTLLFAAKDEKHNNAVVLMEYLQKLHVK